MHKKVSINIMGMFFILCLGLLSHPTEAAKSAIEAEPLPEGAFTFFNVGQGHSALVTAEGRPPLLCDAGSLQYDHVASSRHELIGPVVEAIQAAHRKLDPEVYGTTLPLSVVLSHGDEDHYSLIYDILRTINASSVGSRSIRVRAVIGGELEEYGSGRVPYPFADINERECVVSSAEELLNTPKSKAWLTYDAEVGESDRPNRSIVSHVLGERDLDLDFRGDKNARSLVVRAAVKNWSAVLPGDATDKVTRKIVRLYDGSNEMQSDILLASHHGAEKDCNEMGWMSFVNPRASVISAGLRSGWCHPRVEFIRRLIAVANRNKQFRHDLPSHDLYYYGAESYEPTFFKYTRFVETHKRKGAGDIYRWTTKTTLPIYTTHTNGHIKFFSENLSEPFCGLSALAPRGSVGGKEDVRPAARIVGGGLGGARFGATTIAALPVFAAVAVTPAAASRPLAVASTAAKLVPPSSAATPAVAAGSLSRASTVATLPLSARLAPSRGSKLATTGDVVVLKLDRAFARVAAPPLPPATAGAGTTIPMSAARYGTLALPAPKPAVRARGKDGKFVRQLEEVEKIAAETSARRAKLATLALPAPKPGTRARGVLDALAQWDILLEAERSARRAKLAAPEVGGPKSAAARAPVSTVAEGYATPTQFLKGFFAQAYTPALVQQTIQAILIDANLMTGGVLAEKLGVSATSVSNLKAGRASDKMNREIWAKFAGQTGIGIQRLLGISPIHFAVLAKALEGR